MLADVVRGSERARGRARRWEAMGRALRNAGRPGVGSMARLGGRHRALGSEGAPARRPARRRCSAAARDDGAGLRQRRLLQLPARAAARAARRLGRRRDPAREDEGRPRPRRRSRARLDAAREAIGDDAELYVDANGAFARQAGARVGRAVRARVGRELVRGAGLLADLDGPAPRPRARPRPGWRSPPASTPTSSATSLNLLEARAVDCLQARRHALRRHHRLPRGARRRATAHELDVSATARRSSHAHVMCAIPNAAPPRVVPRPRPRSSAMLFDGVLEPDGRRAAAPTARARATGSS